MGVREEGMAVREPRRAAGSPQARHEPGAREALREALRDWLRHQSGAGGRLSSSRQLAAAAGLSHSAVHVILRRGRAGPETLVKIARACGVSPLYLFRLAGWLTEEESTSDLTGDELVLVQQYRQISPGKRRLLREVLEAMLGPASPSPSLSSEADENRRRPEGEA